MVGIIVARSVCFLKGPSKQSLGKGRVDEGGGWEGGWREEAEKGRELEGTMKYYLKHIPRHNKVLR